MRELRLSAAEPPLRPLRFFLFDCLLVAAFKVSTPSQLDLGYQRLFATHCNVGEQTPAIGRP